jgi:hypothetical protein
MSRTLSLVTLVSCGFKVVCLLSRWFFLAVASTSRIGVELMTPPHIDIMMHLSSQLKDKSKACPVNLFCLKVFSFVRLIFGAVSHCELACFEVILLLYFWATFVYGMKVSIFMWPVMQSKWFNPHLQGTCFHFPCSSHFCTWIQTRPVKECLVTHMCFKGYTVFYHGRIILRWIFRKWEGVVGTGWSWLRIGTGGGHLGVRWGTFGFRKCGEFLD